MITHIGQLLFWLFFQPSAWRRYIHGIDPALTVDFCLIELKRAQWRKPQLCRLLLSALVIWPVLGGALLVLLLATAGLAVPDVIASVSIALFFTLAAGAVNSVALALALALPTGIVGALIIVSPGDPTLFAPAFGFTLGMAGCVMASIAGRRSGYSLGTQLGAVFVGIMVGIVIHSGAYLTAGLVSSIVTFTLGSYIPPALEVSVGYGLLGGVWLALLSGGAFIWRTQQRRPALLFGGSIGLAAGLLITVVISIGGEAAVEMTGFVIEGLIWPFVLAAAYALARRFAGPWIGAIAMALAGIAVQAIVTVVNGSIYPVWPTLFLFFTGLLLGLSLNWWRPVLLYPFQTALGAVLYQLDEGGGRVPTRLRYQAAFWDEHQWLPLTGLDDHLVLVAERDPGAGQAAFDYLSGSRQRWAAQAAQIELEARHLARCDDVMTIARVAGRLAPGQLAGPAAVLLRAFSRISQDVGAAVQQTSAYNQRLALSGVEARLDGLLRELTRSTDVYAGRFHPIAAAWRQVVAGHEQRLAVEAEARQEIDSPYVIGIPLTEQQELFVGRTDISSRIEQLLSDRRQTPLLLYGQRRMGKTSLLNNLGRLLPEAIVPLFVDLQGPASRAADHTGLLYNLGRAMQESAGARRGLSLPALSREELAEDPFTIFDEWLGAVEQALDGRTALLALDEFEALDTALANGRFREEAVLGMLRYLIQHRPRFRVLLSGSHSLHEVKRWASYLINVQTIQVSYLNEAEACQLIERPVEGFALMYERAASRRVLHLTRRHPFLIQLLCAEIVALKNEQAPAARRLATVADVETAVAAALEHGSFFFADIEHNQVCRKGLMLLRYLAQQGEGAVIGRQELPAALVAGDGAGLALLVQRELIEPANGGYRFQVEMIRRWFVCANDDTLFHKVANA
jgi:hypothetical protein